MKLTDRIERARLNPELTKKAVRSLAKSGACRMEITQADLAEVNRILADRSQCAEDALDELWTAASNPHPSLNPQATEADFAALPPVLYVYVPSVAGSSVYTRLNRVKGNPDKALENAVSTARLSIDVGEHAFKHSLRVK